MFERAVREFGTIDILVNNAGLQRDSAFADMTLEKWNKVLGVNLTGQFLCARAAVREFLRRGVVPSVSRAAGKIICMSSVHQVIPWAGHANYATSKGGIKLLMESMAQELAPKRIRVNGIAPGAIKTPINASAWNTPEALESLLTLIPYGRIGLPEDIARAAVWLASDDSDYVVGTTLFRRRRHDALSGFFDQRLKANDATHYDVIIVGSGPGGASVAHRLAPIGKRILLIERGDYLPRSRANWDSQTVFVDGAYQADGDLVRQGQREVSSWFALLCGRQFEGLWRGALSNARARFRRNLVTRTASPLPGLSSMRCSSHITPRPSGCFTFTGNAARIRASRLRAAPFPIRRFRTSRASRRCIDGLASDGLHPFHLPLGILLDEEDGKVHADQHMHPLRRVRRISLSSQRQG